MNHATRGCLCSNASEIVATHFATIEATVMLPKTKILILDQPSATHPHFLTNLPFRDFPNYFNHESWFTIWENSEKAGLSKWG